MNLLITNYNHFVKFIKLVNFEGMKLPMELLVNGKISKVMLDQKEITIESDSFLEVDPTGFYLKEIIYE